jgi:hypothetical protein
MIVNGKDMEAESFGVIQDSMLTEMAVFSENSQYPVQA